MDACISRSGKMKLGANIRQIEALGYSLLYPIQLCLGRVGSTFLGQYFAIGIQCPPKTPHQASGAVVFFRFNGSSWIGLARWFLDN